MGASRSRYFAQRKSEVPTRPIITEPIRPHHSGQRRNGAVSTLDHSKRKEVIMPRITVVDPATATGEAKRLLDAVQAGLGVTPNFIRALANAPAALEGFLGLYTIAGKGVLDHRTRERIALAVAEQNGCQYCVSAHTAIGRKVGLDNAEIDAARRGTSADPKAAAAVAFAKALAASAGEVTMAEFNAARQALSEAEIMEVIAHVALNVFTNLIGKSTQIPIDFPEVKLLKAA
jgi:uncharacterized peroxidase-related enzyme